MESTFIPNKCILVYNIILCLGIDSRPGEQERVFSKGTNSIYFTMWKQTPELNGSHLANMQEHIRCKMYLFTPSVFAHQSTDLQDVFMLICIASGTVIKTPFVNSVKVDYI